jgi:hypothetical protein
MYLKSENRSSKLSGFLPPQPPLSLVDSSSESSVLGLEKIKRVKMYSQVLRMSFKVLKIGEPKPGAREMMNFGI